MASDACCSGLRWKYLPGAAAAGAAAVAGAAEEVVVAVEEEEAALVAGVEDPRVGEEG